MRGKKSTFCWEAKTPNPAGSLAESKKKKRRGEAGKFLSGTENMKFRILVFFSFFFFLFSLGGFLVVSGGFH